MDDQFRTTTNGNNGGGGGGGGGMVGLLDSSKSERHVLLMKCPPMVSRSLKSRLSSSSYFSGGPSAKVIVTLDPLLPNDDFSSTQFTMELADTESGTVPKCYSMDMSTDFVPMSVFSESSQGKLSVEGKIYHKFDMKPHNENIEEYGKLCRERTNKYMTKTRQTKVITDDNGSHMRPMPGMFPTMASSAPSKSASKRFRDEKTRRDRGEMEEIMFKLFERQSNWTLKQLLHETDQPEQFLKDMLKDLCFYNNKGASQGTYELKPEYKRSGGEAESK